MVKNKKLTMEESLEQRKQVLASWKTGKDYHLDFEESIPFLQSIPEEKNFAQKLEKAKKQNARTLVQPRAGVPVLNKHIELLHYLQNEHWNFWKNG